MIAEDPFSQYYAELLDDTYDVVDRIVLNAYFPMGGSGGGIRTWWRQLHDGSDADLDNVHLLRMAGRFSRRVRGWARKRDIPVVFCHAGERKHDIALPYLPEDPSFEGIFVVLVGRAQAPVWEVQRSKTGSLNLRRKTPMPWVNHYYFHILDAEWGHLTIKICGQPPFPAQIMLNGHEYVACRARKAGIGFTKEGNCFTSSAPGLAQIAETLRTRAAVGRLRQACERWIYRCVCFGLSFDEQRKSGFHYRYSVFQVEYSRNLSFVRGGQMDQVFDGVIDRTRVPLDVPTLKTIFGCKHRPWRRRGPPPRFELVLERPAYNLTVFKVHFGKRTLKMYTKGERVLRIEAIVHNAAVLRCGKILDRFGDMVEMLQAMLERFLAALRCVDVTCIADSTLDELPLPGQVGSTKVGGVDMNSKRMRAVLESVVALSPAPDGFTSAQLADRARRALAAPYTQRQASYDLKKLRGKDLVRRGRRRPYYEPTPRGLSLMAGLLVLRDKVIKPVLAGAGRPRPGPPPRQPTPADEHYAQLQRQMRALFAELRLVA